MKLLLSIQIINKKDAQIINLRMEEGSKAPRRGLEPRT